MAEREQRLVFGEVASTYQQARPTYPEGLFDAISELTGVRRGDAVLDVGAGTGKVTEGLLARGFRVTAVEPSPGMADVLQERFPQLVVHRVGFEECHILPETIAVVTAGQSWHWVDPERGPRKAAEVLRPRGWLAVFWNSPNLGECEWHDELQSVYARVAPHLTHQKLQNNVNSSVRDNLDKLRHSDLFGAPLVRHVPWVARYTTVEYTTLLATHSDHRLLPDSQRAELHAAIAASIDGRGGSVEHPYVTDLVAAARR
ncbi:MAG TPA: class I SAM-dependent methyltransferase [Acidimicrobiales bacterium]|jgi:SAM-dependent methyltransferase|nr:class I SAM-dependent methyltransferase [Acidimicrobiales bacterium]